MPQADRNLRREIQEKKCNRRNISKRRSGVVFLLFVLVMILMSGIALLRWVNSASNLPISWMIVTGEKYYTTNEDILHAILILGKLGTFISQDVNIIHKQIERLPWIKQVSVRKQWPDGLKIHLVEYVPVARWNDFQLLDTEGKSFSVPVNYLSKEKLPLLYGPEGNEKSVLNSYRQISAVLSVSKIHIKAAFMTARHSWQLITDDDMRIKIGRSDNMKRLERFIKLWPVM